MKRRRPSRDGGGARRPAGLYIAGVPEVRSIAFYIGLIATAVVFAQSPLL